MRYRVLRSPYVVVRARPSTSAPIIGQKFAGATFHATNSAGGWVRITGGPNLGWVLADGRDAEASDTEARKFGRLLLPCRRAAQWVPAPNWPLVCLRNCFHWCLSAAMFGTSSHYVRHVVRAAWPRRRQLYGSSWRSASGISSLLYTMTALPRVHHRHRCHRRRTSCRWPWVGVSSTRARASCRGRLA